jgi:predicted pyridoxine 5'-phosphate oxidase superfamily flavin-nucleotide-binding protein
MAHAFSGLMFTPIVKSLQERFGSRDSYRRFEAPEAPPRDSLGPDEAEFLAARDSFYMATVSETGWPYVQHRGGPPGFLKVLDDRTIGFADFRGNRQYVSTGNLLTDDRVSLILMDYPNKRRLKILGRARILEPETAPDLLASLEIPEYRARVERGFLIHVEAFDWNCPQHITPRYTLAEIAEAAAQEDPDDQPR